MAKSSNTHGYIGESPTQLVTNTGVHSVGDALELSSIGNWGGSLENISRQSITSGTTVEFTDLKDYNVHMVTLNQFQSDSASTGSVNGRLSNDGGTSYISTSSYHRFFYRTKLGGASPSAIQGTTFTQMESFFSLDTDYSASASVIFFYNLLDSDKYSKVTFISQNGVTDWVYFGGFMLPIAETHNAIQFYLTAGNFASGEARLYGLKEL